MGRKQARNGRITLPAVEEASRHPFAEDEGSERLISRVCHHDTLKVIMPTLEKAGWIGCTNCQYVIFDNNAQVSFADIMTVLMERYKHAE